MMRHDTAVCKCGTRSGALLEPVMECPLGIPLDARRLQEGLWMASGRLQDGSASGPRWPRPETVHESPETAKTAPKTGSKTGPRGPHMAPTFGQCCTDASALS
eukprot:3419174-Pyramimonas_sp.AAC.1